MTREIYFLCPDAKTPYGGVRKIYRHVDILNRRGIAASVLHTAHGFRCAWFANTTRVAYMEDVLQGAIRCLVLPEIAGPAVHARIRLRPPLHPRLPWLGARHWDVRRFDKVIFNQNAYLTMRGMRGVNLGAPNPYEDPSIKAVITVSKDSQEYLHAMFPKAMVLRVHNSINPALFKSSNSKQRLIAYMPRKAEAMAKQVQQLLQVRGKLQGFQLDAIDGVSEAEVAQRLSKAMFYLSLTEREGFGLSAAEAMASGCVVIGFPAGGGKEFFDPHYSIPVADGDGIALVEQVEAAIARAASDPDWVQSMGQRAADAIRAHYSPQQEEEDVWQAWQEILPRLSNASAAA